MTPDQLDQLWLISAVENRDDPVILIQFHNAVLCTVVEFLLFRRMRQITKPEEKEIENVTETAPLNLRTQQHAAAAGQQQS